VRKLTWRRSASDQLDGILGYIAENDKQAADRLEQRITEILDTAIVVPFMGRPGRLAGTRELIVHANYIVVYRVTDTAINILRVLHARKQYP
jgi:toxin ParE1/3/4